MRAALLPICGNPYVLGLWLRSFERVWRKEIDKLLVAITVPVEEPVMACVMRMLTDAGAVVICPDLRHSLPHGEMLGALLQESSEEYLLLMEDDCFVLKAGAVDSCFRALESGCYDVAASSRASATPGIVARARQLFDTVGDPFFWPSMFFAAREMLTRTDGNFGARSWRKGEYIAPLDFHCERDECADTFGWASIQIRANSPRVLPISQFHGQPQDSDDFAASAGPFRDKPPWIHFGSLSGSTHLLMDEDGIIIAYRGQRARGHMEDICPESSAEIERRLAMWMLCRECFPIADPRAAYYNEVFDLAVSNVLRQKADTIARERVSTFMSAYATLFAALLSNASA